MKQRKEPDWHGSFLPYWRMLPALHSSTLFCKELFTERHIELLQDEELVRPRWPALPYSAQNCIDCTNITDHAILPATRMSAF